MSDPESLKEEIAALRTELARFRQETIQALQTIGRDKLEHFCELTWTFGEDGWLRICFEGETYAEADMDLVYQAYEETEQGTIELRKVSNLDDVHHLPYLSISKPREVAQATFHKLFLEIEAYLI